MGWIIAATICLSLCFTLWGYNKPWVEKFVFKPLCWTALAIGLGFVGTGLFSIIYSLSIENYKGLERNLWMTVAGVFMLLIVGINVVSEKGKAGSKKEV